MRFFGTLLLLLCVMTSCVLAQEHQHGMPMPEAPTAQHEHEDGGGLSAVVLHHASSGTSVAPASTAHPMLMKQAGGWMLMLHGVAFLADIQQSGPRGGDKFIAPNWVMGMAQHELGPGQFTFKTMLSLDPATITQRRYPELFQTGEAAFGRPLVDAQHPHDLFMELAAIYDWKVSERALLSIYAAPVGEPAMGPDAFPHRSSASENPVAPLSHHLQDSTHLAASVVTGAVTFGPVRVEASGFHGREPDEHRWDVETGAMDSWATRMTVNPARNWSLQYSLGDLHSPEELHAEEDIVRQTASVTYNRPLARGWWATMAIWGRNHTSDQFNYNGYVLESTLKFAARNAVWTRMENTDKSTDLLGGAHEEPLARVQAFTFGYDRELGHVPHVSIALGGQFTAYGVPNGLRAQYGERPVGGVVFLRLRPE
jgi:hypothetical protein